MRVDDLKADEIIYVVDKRQSLHFEQVFEVAEKLGIAPGVKLQHIGFGTVNGADGKPFKTRDGGVMNLEDLLKSCLKIKCVNPCLRRVKLKAMAKLKLKNWYRRLLSGS